MTSQILNRQFSPMPTRFERDVPAHDPDYAYMARTSEGTWRVFCVSGPSFLWNPEQGKWICVIAPDVDFEDGSFDMTVDAAAEVLSTVKTVRRQSTERLDALQVHARV